MEKNPRSALDVVTVFLDTSLDTHLAMTVGGNDTVFELKSKAYLVPSLLYHHPYYLALISKRLCGCLCLRIYIK